ncbi:hypothetical protein NQ317_008254 [Molorchus minor]|uniref:PiggyBac transposable element-derived protein domain-containing protein n=1 Tax=Molorchus minor TaxID=1323400 RepID=A0ABQ9JBE6_9CUCU|nr:hypothetical protein NQ317_008254 [Molorchus minor]
MSQVSTVITIPIRNSSRKKTYKTLGSRTIKIAPILNTGRNITMDNYFISVPLAQDLLAVRTTIVATLRKNKKEIPLIFLDWKNRPAPSSMFGFQKDAILVSYKRKPNKNVLLLSTFHSGDINDPQSRETQKPETVTFYNLTKGGADVVDELKIQLLCIQVLLPVAFAN